MVISKFEDYWNEILTLPNIYSDNVAVGCFTWDIDNGFSLNDYSYVGPDDAGTVAADALRMLTNMNVLIILGVLSSLMY